MRECEGEGERATGMQLHRLYIIGGCRTLVRAPRVVQSRGLLDATYIIWSAAVVVHPIAKFPDGRSGVISWPHTFLQSISLEETWMANLPFDFFHRQWAAQVKRVQESPCPGRYFVTRIGNLPSQEALETHACWLTWFYTICVRCAMIKKKLENQRVLGMWNSHISL